MKLNENLFTILIIAVVTAITFALVFAGVELTAAEIVSTNLINAVLPLGVGMCFLYFLRGTKFDVLEEVFDRRNVAAAIFIYALFDLLSKPFGR